MAKRLKGVMKWWNATKGFGAIKTDEGNDVFAHFSAFQDAGYKNIKDGQQVEFEVEKGPKGLQAVNIKAIKSSSFSDFINSLLKPGVANNSETSSSTKPATPPSNPKTPPSTKPATPPSNPKTPSSAKTANPSPVPKPRALRVFLCHSRGDKPVVKKLYNDLKSLKEENIDPWLDEEKLIPGQNWEYEIKKAVRSSDIVIVCLSQSSIDKDGYVQKEIKYALDIADEKPDGKIFLIPLRLENCQVPERLGHLQWVDYFERDRSYKKLLKALREYKR